MSESGESGRRAPAVLEAVFDRLEESPGRSEAAPSIFRAEALAHLDVAEEIDNRLSLVTRRTWLALLGAALLCAAVVVLTAFAPIERAVNGTGRVLDPPGVLRLEAQHDGNVTAVVPAPGTAVVVGDTLGSVQVGDVTEPAATAPANGTVWQVFVGLGQQVSTGDLIATVLPITSGSRALVSLPEPVAASIEPGSAVTVRSLDGHVASTVKGTVEAVGPPLPADAVAEVLGAATGSTLSGNEATAVVVVRLNENLREGSLVDVRIVTSRSTLLRRLLGSES